MFKLIRFEPYDFPQELLDEYEYQDLMTRAKKVVIDYRKVIDEMEEDEYL